MQTNRMDRITDLMKERVKRAFVEIGLQYKGTNPYRMEKMNPREQLYKYEQISPEIKIQFQQEDPVAFDQVEQEMEKLRRKYNAR